MHRLAQNTAEKGLLQQCTLQRHLARETQDALCSGTCNSLLALPNAALGGLIALVLSQSVRTVCFTVLGQSLRLYSSTGNVTQMCQSSLCIADEQQNMHVLLFGVQPPTAVPILYSRLHYPSARFSKAPNSVACIHWQAQRVSCCLWSVSQMGNERYLYWQDGTTYMVSF